jgi:hypothetical protein
MSKLNIALLFVVVLGYAFGGLVLGEQLQKHRRPGIDRLEYPGRYILGWPKYLDRSRYDQRGLTFIILLVIFQLIMPIAFFVVMVAS